MPSSANPFDSSDDEPSPLPSKPSKHPLPSSSPSPLSQKIPPSQQTAPISRRPVSAVRRDAAVRRTKGPSPNLFKKTADLPDIHGRDELLSGGASQEASSVSPYDDSQFRQQDLEYKSLQELEGYAVQKSKETTTTIQSCLKVAEEIRGDATQTLVTLQQQGDQIRQTHEVALEIDQNLSRGEKFLGSLGGMFSRTWKPKKTSQVKGPAFVKNDSFKRRGNHLEQRVALGLHKTKSKGRNRGPPVNLGGTQTTQEIIDMEKFKQDDALSDLSNVLDELKGMSLDMGKEIASQNVYLDDLEKDVTILNERVAGANHRARHLLRK